MGYTHYFNATLTPALLADIRAILAATTVPLADVDGEGAPVVTDTEVLLNGVGEDCCEAFVLLSSGPETGLDTFCKTSRAPYDEVVTAILISVVLHQGGGVASDGSWAEWSDGLVLFQRAVRSLTVAERVDVAVAVQTGRNLDVSGVPLLPTRR